MKVNISYNKDGSSKKPSIKIDKQDTWGMDTTLALIIVPMLVQLKKTKQGTPNEMFSKRYNEIVSSEEFYVEKQNGPLHKEMNNLHKEAVKRWNDTLSKMIWSFKEISKDYPGEEKFYGKKSFDVEAHKEYRRKVDEGTIKFGVHYNDLWD